MVGIPAGHFGSGGLSGIADLPDRIGRLAGGARHRADRLIEARGIEGQTDPPPSLEPWLIRTFGSVEAVRRQRLVRVTNLATLDATIFAPLRSRRPIQNGSGGALADEIAATIGDPFCKPEQETPANTFGRVRGEAMITGANAALADAHHAVLVFDTHDPLDFGVDFVADVLGTGRAWAERARETDPSAVHYLLAWNCLWRAGGSIVHGHAQVLLGHARPHAHLDRFLRDATAYREAHAADLVDDLVAVHADLDLAVEADGVVVLAHLTPIKERELLIVGAAGMDERDAAFSGALGRILVAYRDLLGVQAFNLALWRAPLGGDARGQPMRPIVRLVDRGDPMARSSDIGAMELYGTPIVGADPYDVIAVLHEPT